MRQLKLDYYLSFFFRMCQVYHVIALSAIIGISLAFPDANNNGQDATQEPLVTLSLGKIKGSVLTTRLGKPIFAFRGIRYAKAPVEELRFKVCNIVDLDWRFSLPSIW